MLHDVEILIFRITGIHPGHAALHLFCISIDTRTFHTRYRALVTVFYLWDDLCSLAETQIRQGLFRTGAKCLALLRSVDLCQPYFDLLVLVIENGQGIAIGYANNCANECLSLNC